MTVKETSSIEKIFFYTGTGALIVVAMLSLFAIVGAAQGTFDLGDLESVLFFLAVGLLMTRIVGFLLVRRRPMP